MKITQLSIFAENKPGRTIAPFRTLADARINLRALSLADSQQFGILRIIVDDWQRAAQLLRDAGFIVKAVEVVALEVADEPGGMARVISALESTEINIEYMYAFPYTHGQKAVLIVRFDKPDEAIAILQQAGINVLDGEQL